MKSKAPKDVKKLEADDPVPASMQINNSSTFWDWVQKDHPLLLKLVFAVVFIIILVATAYISWIIPVFIVISFILGHFIFKGAFWSKDSVIVVSAYEKDPSMLDVVMVGRDRFRRMKKSGTAAPFSTSSGGSIYVSDDFDSNHIVFPWCFETSRLEFMLRRDSFDKVKALAEDSTRQLHNLKHIPQVLAMQMSSKIIEKYEAYYTEILEGSKTMDEVAAEALKELEEMEDIEYV